jgi:hypothetical protein
VLPKTTKNPVLQKERGRKERGREGGRKEGRKEKKKKENARNYGLWPQLLGRQREV